MFHSLRFSSTLQKEPYHFSHLLFISRVFLSSASAFEEDPNAALTADGEGAAGGKKGGKKSKKAKAGNHTSSDKKAEEQTWMYHPEDEFIARVSSLLDLCHCSSIADALFLLSRTVGGPHPHLLLLVEPTERRRTSRGSVWSRDEGSSDARAVDQV